MHSLRALKDSDLGDSGFPFKICDLLSHLRGQSERTTEARLARSAAAKACELVSRQKEKGVEKFLLRFRSLRIGFRRERQEGVN
jgi:hypothetical protein